ncbi:MAG: hypothetical protein AB7V23_04055, partial [Candidatus Nanopelagicales bacterium]
MIRTTGRASALAAAAALLVGGAAVAAQPAGAAAPTATSTSLPTLAPVSLTSAKLPRKPPTLTNATVIKVKDQMGEIKLNPSRDYRILLPTTRAWKNNRGLWITGGHTVVVIGGPVDDGYGWRDGSGKVDKRAAYFRD